MSLGDERREIDADLADGHGEAHAPHHKGNDGEDRDKHTNCMSGQMAQ
jgi:hypothetical protein